MSSTPIRKIRQSASLVSYICFSGNFAYEGQKPAVEKYIVEHGEIVDSNVKKSTDYLIIGSDYWLLCVSSGFQRNIWHKSEESNRI